MRSPSHNNRSRQGFTVVELLVATGITLALGAMLVSITVNVLEGWRRSSGRLSAESQARLVLDQLERDLHGVVYRPDGNCYLAATVLTGTGNTPDFVTPFSPLLVGGGDPLGIVTNQGNLPFKEATAEQEYPADGPGHRSLWLQHGNRSVKRTLSIAEQRFGIAGTWLRFFSMAPDGAPAGTISAVSYQIVRRRVTPSPDAEVRWLLHRHIVRPYSLNTPAGARPGVLDAGMSLWPTNDQSYYDALTGTLATNNTGAGAVGAEDPITVRRPGIENVIANNVVDFGVRFYKRSGGELNPIFPVGYRSTGAIDTFISGKIDMRPYTRLGVDGNPGTADDLPVVLGPDRIAGTADDASLGIRFAGGLGTPNRSDIAHFVSSRVVPSYESSGMSSLPNRSQALENPANRYAGMMPDVIEVMVRILTEEGARQIHALETGRLGIVPPDGLANTPQGRSEWWWRIAEANSVVFTRQIELKPRAF